MADFKNALRTRATDYSQMRTVPAALSVAFVMASLYQFGGLGILELPWLDYTLETSHAILISLGSYAAAFASSETKDFEHYEQWEQVVLALAPVVIIGQEYVGFVNDLLLEIGDPLGYQIAFIITVVSWGVAGQ